MVLVKAENPVLNDPYCEIVSTDGSAWKVDPSRYTEIFQHRWSTKRSFCRQYAMRHYRQGPNHFYVFMHRQVAETPRGMVCHHINGDTHDNRRRNLLNMSSFDHIKRHSWR